MKQELPNRDYDSMSYKALKDEAANRDLEVPQDARSKAGIAALLRRNDEERAEAKAVRERDKEPAVQSEDELSPLEALLKQRVPQPSVETLKAWGQEPVNMNRVEEGLRVRNLPADYIHAWAALTGGEEDLMRYTSLGWMMVTKDMVTSNPLDKTKIFVPSFDLHQGDYVRHQDTVLVIAHRDIVNSRVEVRNKNWNSRVESMYGKRGKLNEDKVVDPTEATSGNFRRSAQMTPEDMLSQGGDR